MNDPVSEGRMEALRNMGGPDGDEGELDADGSGDVTLAEISDALSELIETGGMPEQMAADLSQARDILEKYSSREAEPAMPDEAEEEKPLPTEGE